MIHYFIEVVAADEIVRRDFKSFRETSYQLFKAGHIQDLRAKTGCKCLIIVSKCLPEMKKEVAYDLIIIINNTDNKCLPWITHFNLNSCC